MTLKQARIQFPYLNWVEYLNLVLSLNVTVNSSEIVSFISLPYFENFGELLEKTSNRTLANYLIWRITLESASYLNDDIRKCQLDYMTVFSGEKESLSRQLECSEVITSKLSTAVGALYIRKHFQPNTYIQRVRIMFDQIRNEFKEGLRKNEWMDTKTKLTALKKIDAIMAHIGYPDELYDNKKLEEFHKNIKVDRSNYLSSILNINQFVMKNNINSLRKPVNRTDWITHSAAADRTAYNSLVENVIGLLFSII